MAIETRIINGSHTEIYVGGDNFITQSAPTNFHQFYKRKVLTATENISDYKEVTEAEKMALEADDAKWERPPQAFIDGWNNAAGSYGTFNEATGFFELNGLTDITYEQAMVIDRESSGANYLCSHCHARSRARTFYLMDSHRGAFGQSGEREFTNSLNLEVIWFYDSGYTSVSPTTFMECHKLREINGAILRGVKDNCLNLPEIETFKAKLTESASFSEASKMSLATVTYLIEQAVNTKPITITLHPDTYALLTDGLMAAAAEKNITIATT